MALDHYVTLGRSGLRVSPLALGAMTFGEDLGWGASVQESEAMLDRYVDLGGNFVDTANGYTKGHSETIIGDHLGHDRAKRDRLVLATKFSTNLYPGDPNGGGSSRKAVIAAAEQSLRRLRTDYIDLYWLHNWDKHTPIEETMAALDALVRDGKVRYVGISDTPAWKTAQAQLVAQVRGWAPVIAIQIEYSLGERTVEGELVPMAQELGMGVVPWSPLGGGKLSGKYTRVNAGGDPSGRAALMGPKMTDTLFAIVDELGRIARDLGSTIPRVALAWVMARPGVASAIMGVRTVAQLDDDVQALGVRLTPEQTARLDALSTPQLPFPLPFLAGAAAALHQGGTTVNGVPSTPHPFAAQHPGDHY